MSQQGRARDREREREGGTHELVQVLGPWLGICLVCHLVLVDVVVLGDCSPLARARAELGQERLDLLEVLIAARKGGSEVSDGDRSGRDGCTH